MAGRAGLSGRRPTDTTDRVMALWQAGYGYDEIAEIVGIKKSTCQTKITELGLTDREVTKNWMQKKGVSKQLESICVAHGMDATESSIGDVWDAVCAELKACRA